MNHVPFHHADAFDAPAPADPQVLRVRAVHRAMTDARRGVPVILLGEQPLIVVPAETAGAQSLVEVAALAVAPPLLLFPASVGHTPSAVELPPDLLTQSSLRALAEPPLEERPSTAPGGAALPAQAEAALTLTKLARLLPATLAAPIGEDFVAAADERGLQSVPAADVLSYRRAVAAPLERVAEAPVPLEDAPDARVVGFRAPDGGTEHLAILIGQPEAALAPLVRLHSECFTGDLLGSLRCDCGPQLRGAIQRIAADGAGAVLYLAQEGRGIGLMNKLRAYQLQDRGLDTLDANRALGWGADERDFQVAATMLAELGLRRVRLLTNNPDKVAALAACGIDVQREPLRFAPNGVNDRYLATKALRFGHLLG